MLTTFLFFFVFLCSPCSQPIYPYDKTSQPRMSPNGDFVGNQWWRIDGRSPSGLGQWQPPPSAAFHPTIFAPNSSQPIHLSHVPTYGGSQKEAPVASQLALPAAAAAFGWQLNGPYTMMGSPAQQTNPYSQPFVQGSYYYPPNAFTPVAPSWPPHNAYSEEHRVR